MVLVNCSGPDGQMSLCSACNKMYCHLRLPLFKHRSGSISARASDGAIPVIATGFDTVSKYSGKFDMSSPQVRSATAEEHCNLRRMRRVFNLRSNGSQRLPRQPCFACRSVSGERKVRHSGPDGAGTLCSNCNRKYVALNLPLFRLSSGNVSARAARGAARLVAVGFERNEKKGRNRRDHCKPVVRPSSKREHSFLMRKSSLDNVNEGTGEEQAVDEIDGGSEEEEDQKILFEPAEQSGEERHVPKGDALPRKRSRNVNEEEEDKLEPTSKRARKEQPNLLPCQRPSALVDIPQPAARILPASSQPESTPTSAGAAQADSASPGIVLRAISLRGFCVKASCRFGWRSEKRMVFVAYGARFLTLERALRNLFGMQVGFEVSYVDVEGDEISVSSDVEMHPLFMQAKIMKNSLSVQVRPMAVVVAG